MYGIRRDESGIPQPSPGKVKWIDDKILEVDIHLGRVFHVIEKSVISVPPPVVVKKAKRVIVEGGA